MLDHLNPVRRKIDRHHIPVAIKGRFRIPKEELRLSAFIETCLAQQVEKCRIGGVMNKCVVILKDNSVFREVELHRITAFALKRDSVAIVVERQFIVRVFVFLMIEKIEQFCPIAKLHIWQIINPVNEAERERFRQLCIQVPEVGRITAFFDIMPHAFFRFGVQSRLCGRGTAILRGSGIRFIVL